MTETHDDHRPSDPESPAVVTPRPWPQTRMQPRARPQWDPVDVARQQLDDMEKGGRLHGRLAKKS